MTSPKIGPGSRIDLLVIDGDHTVEGVKATGTIGAGLCGRPEES